MHTIILQQLGLSLNEAKIYETLINYGQLLISDISTKSGIHRRNVYDSMDRLIEKGLVFQVIGRGDHLYKPVDPNKLMELVDEKRRDLEKVIPKLQKEYKKQPQLEACYIYKGIEGFKNYLRDILLTDEDAYFIGAKGAWFDPRLKIFVDKFLVDAEKQGVKYTHLFDYEVKERLPQITKLVGKPYKFLPKDYSTPSMIDIFSDHVVSFIGAGLGKISDGITIFVIISRLMVTSYKTWFKFMWDMCPSVNG